MKWPLVAFLVGTFLGLCLFGWAATYSHVGYDPAPAGSALLFLVPILGGIAAVALVKYGPALLQERRTRIIGIAMGGGAGALLGACLVFLTGFFLPMLLSTSNIGPLIGIYITPKGAGCGCLVGVVVAILRPSRLRSFLIGTLVGLMIVVTLYISGGAWAGTDTVLVYAVSTLFIFGFIGFVIRAVVVRAKSEPGSDPRAPARP